MTKIADRTVVVTLAANVAPYVGPMGAATSATKGLATSATGMGNAANKAGTQGAAGMQKMATAAAPAATGMKVVAGGAIALGVAVGLGVKKFMDFDAQMSSVQAATGATGAELESLRAAAIKMGADTKFGATEAAEGIESLSKAGIESKDILGGALKGALDLAAAGEVEVAEAADLAASAMTQFNLEGADVPHVADLMAAAAGKAQGSVSDMAMAFKQSGLVASQMGLSIEDTTGTLAAFASAGLIGSDAGTSFRTMLLRLANPANEAKELMQQLGISAYDAQGQFVGMSNLARQLQEKLGDLAPAQRDAALATIFGSDAIRAANILYQQGAVGIDDWTAKVDDAGFASEQAAARTDNLRGDLERLAGSIESLAISAGSTVDGPLRKLVQNLTDLAEAGQKAAEDTKGPRKTLGDLFGFLEEHGGILFQTKLSTDDLSESVHDLGDMTAEQQFIMDGNIANTYKARDASGEFEEQTKATKEAVELETEALEELRDQYFDTMNAALGLSDATIGYEQALDDAAEAVGEIDKGTEGFAKTLDINTQAGRDNQAALDDIASAALGVTDQMYATGASEADVTAKNATMRNSLYNAAIQFGMTEKEAHDYTDRVLGIPPKADTTANFNSGAATATVNRYLAKLASLPKEVESNIKATYSFRYQGGTGGMGGPQSALGSGNRVFPLPGGKGAYPITQGLHPVNAIDYGARSGTPLYASFNGTLTTANLGNRSYGKYYRLEGSGQRPILVAHLSNFARGSGPIAQGALIGWTGTSGNSTGPHAHIENFDEGGILGHGGMAQNMSGRPERILNPSQTESFDKLVAVLAGGQSAGATYVVNVHVSGSVTSERDLARTIKDGLNRFGRRGDVLPV